MASLRVLDQLSVERVVQAVVLRLRAAAPHVARHRRIVEHRGEIDPLRLPVLHVRALREAIHAANHFVDFSEAQFRHDQAQVFGNVEQEINHVLGLAREFLAQLRILRRDAHRASIQVAFAHHDAAHGDQRRGGKSEFLGAQQRGDRDVAPGLQLAVHLHAHAAAQIVHHQDLLRLGKPEFPGNSRVADRADRRSAGPAIVAADEDHIGMRLGHARRHGAHAHFGHELHGNSRLRIDIFQIENQLRQILDRINIVMRRRRNQAHAGDRVAHAGDHVVHFVARATGRLRRASRPERS